MSINLSVNNQPYSIDIEDEQTPLLWVIRDLLNLKGTKYGCGLSSCGSCTILVDGEAIRSCSFPVSYAAGKNIITIEGLGSLEKPHPVQQAWIEEIVPQCGYCQPGFIMATAGLLIKNPTPTDEQIDEEITNVCRCATYYRMRKAIHRAAEIGLEQNKEGQLDE
ncbi:MAG: (2Fe-2S)-binding protein [Bacteroidia bacterium]|nr:(2Fe-2S)-binding protein [Bacteroidia bacterium]MBT8269360.1 (2Fe-2S)-binding protein [Bacteroidia bacterium]NNK69178.1 (2Fe-2S)-binding protein [Flavobacteriaceae bacterium]NNL79086.1 (2Fe-2S)-binding protein [Flavobacteriaceae bacterium]